MEIHHAVTVVRWRYAHTEQAVGPLERNSRHVELLALENWKKRIVEGRRLRGGRDKK